MNNKFKYFIAGVIILISVSQSFGQEIKISENLVLYKLSESFYEYTQEGDNGLVYINKGEAAIVSIPDSDIETQNLIDY